MNWRLELTSIKTLKKCKKETIESLWFTAIFLYCFEIVILIIVIIIITAILFVYLFFILFKNLFISHTNFIFFCTDICCSYMSYYPNCCKLISCLHILFQFTLEHFYFFCLNLSEIVYIVGTFVWRLCYFYFYFGTKLLLSTPIILPEKIC